MAARCTKPPIGSASPTPAPSTCEPRTSGRRALPSSACVFVSVLLKRPRRPGLKGLPDAVSLTLVEAVELDLPHPVESVHRRLLTTHPIANEAAAWQIVDWYKKRWLIEQLFRVLKSQGLRIEDSQLDSADLLIKLIAIATKAAAITIQLLQAREGLADLPASVTFDPRQIGAVGRHQRSISATIAAPEKTPHPHAAMAWASWIIARLGGWDGYPSSKPPGPITLKHGLDRFFEASLQGWTLKRCVHPVAFIMGRCQRHTLTVGSWTSNDEVGSD